MKEKKRRAKRKPWYLLTGIFLGLMVGLIFSLVLLPTQYIDVSPDVLSNTNRDRYRAMIALAYQADHDLGRAKTRLALLGDDDAGQALSIQAQQSQALDGQQKEAQALALLASDLQRGVSEPVSVVSPGLPDLPGGEQNPAATVELGQVIQTPTPAPTLTPTPLMTFTPRPSSTPVAALALPFALDTRKEICDPDLPQGLVQIEVSDADRQPVAGVQINITWNNGQETFFTGLHPEVSPGYADFIMAEDQQYRLRVGDLGRFVDNLAPPKCKKTDGTSYIGGWELSFKP